MPYKPYNPFNDPFNPTNPNSINNPNHPMNPHRQAQKRLEEQHRQEQMRQQQEQMRRGREQAEQMRRKQQQMRRDRKPTRSAEKLEKLMRCSSCGRQNREGAQFCYDCGAPLPQGNPAVNVAPLQQSAPLQLQQQTGSSKVEPGGVGWMSDFADAVSEQPITPELHASVPVSDEHQFSRRAKVVGFVGLAVVVGVAISIWLVLFLRTTPGATSGPASGLYPTATPTLTTSQQAQVVVQAYFNDINQKDYQDAYNLRGASYQNSHPYNQFADGYANTVHDDITFGSITPLSDGTVQVWVTIKATETPGTRTFQGYYIVGQESNIWKLLRSSIQQIPG